MVFLAKKTEQTICSDHPPLNLLSSLSYSKYGSDQAVPSDLVLPVVITAPAKSVKSICFGSARNFTVEILILFSFAHIISRSFRWRKDYAVYEDAGPGQ